MATVRRPGRSTAAGSAPVFGAVGIFIYLRTMLVFGCVWYIAASAVSNRLLLPSPLEVAGALHVLAASGDLTLHGLTSLVRLLISVTLAALLGLPLGLLIGLSRSWEDAFELPIELLRPIAGIAWIPLALFMFGIGHTLPIFIMFYTAFFPLVIGAAAGVRNVDPRLIAASRTMGVPAIPLVLRVILPASLPAIIVSMRLGVAAAWTAVVAAELVGAPSGLGYAIEYSRSMLATDSVIAFIVVIGLLRFLTDKGLRILEERLAPWSRDRSAS